MQFLGCGVLVAMAFIVVYMYRIIDEMHQEQQAMRMQIAALTGGGPVSLHHPQLRSGQAGPAKASQEQRAPATHSAADPDAEFAPRLRAAGAAGAAEKEDTWRQEPAAASAWAAGGAGGAAAADDAAGDGAGDAQQRAPGPELEEVDGLYYDVGNGERRKLSFMATVGTGATDGCYTITDAAAVSYDVSGATTCGPGGSLHPCPDCFVTSTMTQDITLTIAGCSSAKWIRGTSRAGVWVYNFVNPHATRLLTVTDNSDNSGPGRTTYNIPPQTFVQAYCSSSLGTTNRLYFPSTQVPTLKVDSAITLVAGDFDASSSSGAFKTSGGTNTLNGDVVIDGSHTLATGTGAATLNGATTVADSTAFTVGSSGNGGTTTLYGDVVVGHSSNLASTTLNGPFTQAGAATFATGTSVISLNGDIEVAAGKDLKMLAGAGTFSTGTGDVTLSGDVTIAGSKTFATGTGAVTLNGDTTVADGKTFNVGTTNGAGTTTLKGDVIVGGSGSSGTKSITLYGDFTQSDGADGAQTFTTASGQVTINGDVSVSAGKDLHMVATSTGTFQTGVGDITLNGDTSQTSSKTFATGTGAVTLNGATTVKDNMPFSVGSPGAGGAIQLFGAVTIGGSTSGTSTSLTAYGNVEFKDDAGGTAKGLIVRSTGTAQFYGNVNLEQDVNFNMHNSGSGTFATGAGAVSLNGDTTVTGTKTFRITAQGAALQCAATASFTAHTFNYCGAR